MTGSVYELSIALLAITYAAGASLFRPMVRKNSDMSCKQSSSTLSTIRGSVSLAVFDGSRDLRRALLAQHTSVLLIPFRPSYVVQSMYLVYKLLVVYNNILRSDILCLVCLKQLKTVADLDEALKDGLFFRIYRQLVER